ncbi:MAG: UbiA family prenyltransferase [Acidobacteriota bacterium]
MLPANDSSLDAALARVRAYASWIRYRDILALQGAPLLGAVFALREVTAERLLELPVLGLANLLLVAHIFVINDWAGVDADLNDVNKRAGVFASRGLSRDGIRRLGIALLASSLGLFGFLGPGPLALAAAIVILSALYSRPRSPLKGVPILSSVLHIGGGMLHFLVGVSLFRAIDGPAIGFALFCGLAFAAGHLNQEVRDLEGDRDNRITTNAVAFGKRRTFIAGLVLFTAAYAQLFALAATGVIPGQLAILGCLYPAHLYWSWKTMAEGLSFDSIRRFQARYRALYAVIGAAVLSTLLVTALRPIGTGRSLHRPDPSKAGLHWDRDSSRSDHN